MVLYAYPEQTIFNRRIARQKIYDNAYVSPKIKSQFKNQLKSIHWTHKLSQATLNLAKTDKVPEIVILRIEIIAEDISTDILTAIDKSIPLPIIYEITNGDKTKMMGIYKRPNEADKSKWTTQGQYLSTDWLPVDKKRKRLPTVSNLEQLYDKLLGAMLPIEVETGEDIAQSVEMVEKINKLKSQKQKLENKLKTEKQFNRKVEIQQKINAIEFEINSL